MKLILRLSIRPLSLLVLPFVLIASAVAIPMAVNNARVQTLIVLPTNAEYRFRADSYYGADTAQRRLYHWSSASLEQVENELEQTYRVFEAGDEANRWRSLVRFTEEAGTEACHYQQQYQCIVIHTVDLTAQNILDLPINPGPYFGLMSTSDHAIYRDLQTLPQHGTLIIYSYWVSDF